jgi:hypothetical protein
MMRVVLVMSMLVAVGQPYYLGGWSLPQLNLSAILAPFHSRTAADAGGVADRKDGPTLQSIWDNHVGVCVLVIKKDCLARLRYFFLLLTFQGATSLQFH